MSYTLKEVYESCLRYFGGDELAADVFSNKYALQDLQKVFHELDPEYSHRRVASELARIEQKYPDPVSEDEIFSLLSNWEFVVQGSPMSGIGNPYQVQSISNCFVIDPAYDSYGGIMLTDEEQVQIMKRRGGVGHDISRIRPRGLVTANAARTSEGIAGFMTRFSNSTREVAQEGRRGALMLTISVHHPEIMTFINIKRDKKKVTGANISIRCSEEFMRAVDSGEKYQLRFPIDPDAPHIIEEWVDAKDIWRNIMEAAHECAEPGVLFWDTILNGSPADCYADVGYRTSSTNPCGELPLSPYDSCRLAYINLSKFVINPFTDNAMFDYERLRYVSRIGQRLMDDIVDLELEMIDRILVKIDGDPEPEYVKLCERNLWQKIKKATSGGRRTGFGVTAEGDVIAMMGRRYGSPDSIALASEIHRVQTLASYASSVEMAEQRGPFPVYDFTKEKDHPFILRVLSQDPELLERWKRSGRRNIANMTLAPVGSGSLLTRTTSGIEPCIYAESRRRRKVNPGENVKVDFVDELGDSWQEYDVVHHGVELWRKVTGKTDVRESPYWGSTAEEIDWKAKVELQSAVQYWIDHSISNTTNLPKDVTVEQVSEIYLHGWRTECKGITIYREGSRSSVLLKSEDTHEDQRDGKAIKETTAPRRPLVLPCHMHRVNVRGQQYLILIGLLDGKPYEVFAGLADKFEEIGKGITEGRIVKHNLKRQGKPRYGLEWNDTGMVDDIVETFDNPSYGALTRMLSVAMRHGVPIKYIVEQLRKDKNSDMWSFSAVIARVLAKSYISDGEKAGEKVCPGCSAGNIIYQQGCATCVNCGWSKCN